MKYECVKPFGQLEPGDVIDLDGEASPEFFRLVPDSLPPPAAPSEPAAPAAPADPAKEM